MDRAANAEIGNIGHLHGFVDDSLSCKGSITVQENGDDIAHIFRTIAAIVLLGTGLSGNLYL